MTSVGPGADGEEPGPVSIVLAGGGSAGHVNPLLATADALRRRRPDARITVLGTAEGLEVELVPARGYDLQVVPKVPFPRRPGKRAVRFPGAMRRALSLTEAILSQTRADVMVGFGGYVAAPAYLAARRIGMPIVVHEQNARPGLANRLGARLTPHVSVTFPGTRLPHAQVIGLPMRREVSELDRVSARPEGLRHFGLRESLPTLLVFGGSLGARRLNQAFGGAAAELATAGVQVLHLTGGGQDVLVPGGPGPVPYVTRAYTDRMELAYAVADLAVCRAGAGTVCELAAVGLPAIYVPLPIGNGEQRLNAVGVVSAGGGVLAQDGQVDSAWVRATVLPLITDRARLDTMGLAAAATGQRHADDRLADMVFLAAARATRAGRR